THPSNYLSFYSTAPPTTLIYTLSLHDALPISPGLLLNNAAIINKNAPLWKVSAEEFDRVIDVNLKGVVNVIRHFVPAMIERGSRSEEHTSELQSRGHLVCRLLLEKKKYKQSTI